MAFLRSLDSSPHFFLFPQRILCWRSLGSLVGAEDFLFHVKNPLRSSDPSDFDPGGLSGESPLPSLGPKKKPEVFCFSGWGKKTHEKTHYEMQECVEK